MRLRIAFVCILAILIYSFTVSSQNAEATELPTFFESMTFRYDCYANVKTSSGSVVFNMTARRVCTVVKVNENASIEQVFTVVSMNGEMPTEVSNTFFPFPLESHNTTIEVTQQTQFDMFLNEDLFADYKARGYFLGEENLDTELGKVGTYHVRKIGAYQTYDIFYDKATGWVVYMKETYGGEPIPNYTVTYSAEIAETNATLSPPLTDEDVETPTFPYSYLLIAGILLAITGVASLFYFRRKSKTSRVSASPNLNKAMDKRHLVYEGSSNASLICARP